MKFLPLIAVLILAGCASSNKFVGISPHPVAQGTGGSPVVVDGVQFWQNTTPHKYAILGYVDDYWLGESMDEFDFKHLASLVKQSGGDAGVVIHGDKPAPGLVRQKDETGDNILRLQVVKLM